MCPSPPPKEESKPFITYKALPPNIGKTTTIVNQGKKFVVKTRYAWTILFYQLVERCFINFRPVRS